MKVVACSKCGANNRVDENRLADSEAKCGRCGADLEAGAEASAGDDRADSDGKPQIITDATFQQEVLQASGTVMVDCWAPWCGPCRIIGPIMDELAAESNGRYRIAKLNVDENPNTSFQYQIASIPTMLIFKNGLLVDRLVGAQPKPAIVARLVRAAA